MPIVPADPFAPEKDLATPTKLGEHFEVLHAQALVIYDVWTGYSPLSPIAARYDLKRALRGGLRGVGVFSTSQASERVRIAVSPADTLEFLVSLGEVDMIPGQYKPTLTLTDAYPSIHIVLHTSVARHAHKAAIAYIFSRSQGEFHRPWGACINGQVFTLPDGDVDLALAALKTPLKRKMLDELMLRPHLHE